MEAKKQYWLVELDQHGNPVLKDGAHPDRTGVESALYILTALGFNRGAKYACAEIALTDVEAIAHDTNHDAIEVLSSIGLRK